MNWEKVIANLQQQAMDYHTVAFQEAQKKYGSTLLAQSSLIVGDLLSSLVKALQAGTKE